MRRTFLIWLFVFICAAFAVTAGVAYWQLQRHARQQAEQLMRTRLHDMLELVDYTRDSMTRMTQLHNETALARTRAVAEIIRLNPAILRDQEQLQGLCNDLGAELIAITDERGVIRASIPASYRGFDITADKNAQEFLNCIRMPGHEYVQPSGMQGGFRSAGVQYVGVHRQDEPGLICLGFRPYEDHRVKEGTAYTRLAANHRLGTTGRIVAFMGGAPLNREVLPGPAADFLALPLESLRRMSFNGRENFVYAVERDGFRLVGMLPLVDIYPTGVRSVRAMFLTMGLVFLAIFGLVSFLLQRIVVSGISSVNDSLRRITEGMTGERVDVATTPEFVKLSTGINAMLDSLKVLDDKEQARRGKELETARIIQRSTLPAEADIPKSAHGEFDVCPSIIPAARVGGDFYDVLMADRDHLSFMVAAVSGTGVPAALFMMRALTVIRNFARGGMAPTEVLAGANRILCEGRTADMHVSLFYGSLELSSGLLTCVNAGHEAPLLQQLGGHYAELSIERSPVLGAIEGLIYRSQQVQLAPGDRLFLYTGGLLRARNRQQQEFGLPRLLSSLEGTATTLAELPILVRQDLRRFTQGAEQENDITMLALEYRSLMRRGGSVELRAGEPKAALDMLSESLEAIFAAPVDIAALQQATSTLLASLPPATPVTVLLGCDETRAELTIRYPESEPNLLEGLVLPGIDSSTFSRSAEGHAITLSKALG